MCRPPLEPSLRRRARLLLVSRIFSHSLYARHLLPSMKSVLRVTTRYKIRANPVGGDLSPMAAVGPTSFRLIQSGVCSDVSRTSPVLPNSCKPGRRGLVPDGGGWADIISPDPILCLHQRLPGQVRSYLIGVKTGRRGLVPESVSQPHEWAACP